MEPFLKRIHSTYSVLRPPRKGGKAGYCLLLRSFGVTTKTAVTKVTVFSPACQTYAKKRSTLPDNETHVSGKKHSPRFAACSPVITAQKSNNVSHNRQSLSATIPTTSQFFADNKKAVNDGFFFAQSN